MNNRRIYKVEKNYKHNRYWWHILCTCGNKAFVPPWVHKTSVTGKCRECYFYNKTLKVGDVIGEWTIEERFLDRSGRYKARHICGASVIRDKKRFIRGKVRCRCMLLDHEKLIGFGIDSYKIQDIYTHQRKTMCTIRCKCGRTAKDTLTHFLHHGSRECRACYKIRMSYENNARFN